jgi:nucleotide-binding universal stress UspA family protein
MTDHPDNSGASNAFESHPVLVAIDFSVDSGAALIWAARFAACSGNRLILLHVVHDPTSEPGFYRQSKQDLMQPMETIAQKMMVEFLAQMREAHPGLTALRSLETRFVPGLPPSRIVEVAELLGAGLIVVGSRGVSGLPHMLLGSVAERVVQLAAGPVVVVKSKEEVSFSKKELKRQAKQQKKDRKKLRKILGLNSDSSKAEVGDDTSDG